MKRRALPFTFLSLGMFAQGAPPQLSGLLQLWYDQALSSNLRNDALATTNGNRYYDLASNYTEDGFVLRRAQLQVAGSAPALEGLRYLLMADFALSPTGPNLANSNAPYNPTVLQDAYLEFRNGEFESKLGQFKNLQTYEGLLSPAELLFAERSQLGRRFADRRDRGLTLGWRFTQGTISGRATVGVFNGTNDLAAGKTGDANAQKDFVARLEFKVATTHTWGAYTLQGRTDQRDGAATPLLAKSFVGPAAPSSAQVLADRDRTTNLGAFYVYDDGTWHADGEVIRGRWGRRLPSVGAQAGPAAREALDQSFLSYYVTGAFSTGAHTFALRYDFLNANQGNAWYTAYNPYTERAPGLRRLVNGAPVDYTPRYREFTVGYTYALAIKASRTANLKVNLIHRSKNFLAPGQGEASEQGGDSLVAALQLAF